MSCAATAARYDRAACSRAAGRSSSARAISAAGRRHHGLQVLARPGAPGLNRASAASASACSGRAASIVAPRHLERRPPRRGDAPVDGRPVRLRGRPGGRGQLTGPAPGRLAGRRSRPAELDLGQVLAVPDLREQAPGLGVRGGRAVQVAVEQPRRCRWSAARSTAPSARRARGTGPPPRRRRRRISPRFPVVFRQARGHHPGRRGEPLVLAGARLVEVARAGARRPWRTSRTPGAAARRPGTSRCRCASSRSARPG